MPYSLPKVRNQALRSFYAWFERLSNEGKMRMGKRLEHEGKIVACGNAMTDGPFIESKETIGGYWFIQAESLEEAAEIARGNPGLDYGLILEVRPDRPQKKMHSRRREPWRKGGLELPHGRADFRAARREKRPFIPGLPRQNGRLGDPALSLERAPRFKIFPQKFLGDS
jgi:hypothetical protein